MSIRCKLCREIVMMLDKHYAKFHPEYYKKLGAKRRKRADNKALKELERFF